MNKLLIAGVLLGIVVIVFIIIQTKSSNNTSTMTEYEKADQLVMSVAKKHGLKPVSLGEDNQVAYGTLLFRYIPENQTIETAILVNHNELWNKIDDEATAATLKFHEGLMDPAIGGLFDTGGGSWRFDETTGKLYLYREYSLDESPKIIEKNLEKMAEVVPEWELTWMYNLAQIIHGHQPLPTRPVNLKDNPYEGQI